MQKIKKILVWILQSIKCVSCCLYKQIGLAYILGKICPHRNPKNGHPTFIIWLASLWIISYGLAAQFYESHLDRFENRRVLLSALLTTDARAQTFPALVNLQKYKLPHEPRLMIPFDGIYTLTLGNKKPLNKNTVKEIAATIVNFKHTLGCTTEEWNEKKWKCVDLSGANLVGADLTKGRLSYINLTGAILKKAKLGEAELFHANLNGINLEGAFLKDAKLQKAELISAYLSEANLTRANFSNSDLKDANLKGANLTGAILEDTNLMRANLLEVYFIDDDIIEDYPVDATPENIIKMACKELKKAKNWETTSRCRKLACGVSMLTPPCVTDKQGNSTLQETLCVISTTHKSMCLGAK